MPLDYANYHPKWRLISRLIRLRRAGNRCEWCGAACGDPHPVTRSKVVLSVAHLDRNRNHNRFSNLAALCQRCHLNYDRPSHLANRRYGRNWKYSVLPLPFAYPYAPPIPTVSQMEYKAIMRHLTPAHVALSELVKAMKSAEDTNKDELAFAESALSFLTDCCLNIGCADSGVKISKD